MPRRRIQPRKERRLSEYPKLSADQQRMLRTSGLSGEALKALEVLARQLLMDKQQNYPNISEIKAALKRISKKAAALRAELDNWGHANTAHINFEHFRDLEVKSAPSLVARVSIDLCAMEHAIERGLARMRVENVYVQTNDAAQVTRIIFRAFDIPFNRSKRSPAVLTTHALMSIVGPTSMFTAENRVRAAINYPDESYSGFLVGPMIQRIGQGSDGPGTVGSGLLVGPMRTAR
jgi:hypothetical protein